MRRHERLLAREHEARLSAELERSRLDTILQNAPTGMLYVEAGSEWVLANGALRHLVQRPVGAEQDPGELLEGLRYPHGAPIAPGDMPWVRALRGEAVESEQLCMEQPSGRWIQLIVNASPVWGMAGEITGAVVSFLDISERCRLEQLQRDYVSLISHDLGGPLNAMAVGVQLLQEMLASRPGSSEAVVIKKIAQSCQAMRAMIDDLLEVGRLEAGGIELRWEPVDLGALVEETLESSLSARDRARVRPRIGDALAPVVLDPRRIGRVILNLVVNALKYSPADSPVEVDLSARGSRATIAVRDHGPGIAPAEAQRLFEKHYRLDATSHTEGSGLGLYICRLIVDAHGGAIDIDSYPGQGATFRVSLPKRQETSGARARP